LLLLDFFDEAFPPFFAAAILLTTFHAVRDLSVAPTWQQVPDRSGKLIPLGGESAGKETPTTFNIP